MEILFVLSIHPAVGLHSFRIGLIERFVMFLQRFVTCVQFGNLLRARLGR